MKDVIKFTDEGVKAIKSRMTKEGVIGLRLVITNSGCGEHGYKMEYVTEENLKADDKYEKDGAVLYVPKTALMYILGTEIGFEETKMKSGFVFNNPMEASRCGCGESFSVKRDLTNTP